MAEATIPLIAFTSDTVSRLTDLTIRQLHYWDRTGFFVPSFADPNRRRPHSRVYSFVDLVALRTIAELRSRGVTWPDLKKVRSFFQEHGVQRNNAAWASRRFFVVGRNVYFTHAEAVVAARPLGQHVDPVILALGPIVDDIERAVRDLPERAEEQIGRVTRDRLLMEGKDVIAGTRIPTATIDWYHRHGYPLAEILEDFPRMRPADVAAAIDHEARKRVLETERVAAV